MQVQCETQWEEKYGVFGGQLLLSFLITVWVCWIYNIYEACICCRQDIKCNKHYYISSGLIRPGVMAISVTLVNETSRPGRRAEDKRKL